MKITTIHDLLGLVEKPSRYLGTEINVVKKDLRKVKLRFALAFPDLYEIGTSHFGLQILYHILNNHSEIAAERVFAPDSDMEEYLRRFGLPLFSLESREPLRHFDIIGFSVLYELNYTNILLMMDLAGIPLRADQRDASFPLIIAGGPCTCNPEPIADFFDALVIGDGERVIMELALAWLRWKDDGDCDKQTLLKQWSRIEGVYIPAFFALQIDRNGFQSLQPRQADYSRVKRAIIDDLDQAPFPEKPIVPYGKPVHDRLRLEVSRGCTRGCRFCQAGMIYRPVRERSPQKLVSLANAAIAATGYEDLSLLSLSTGDYGCIIPLMEQLMARFSSEHVAVSLPSLRAGTLTPELMELIKKVRKTGFTIAPEAGSQRLRDVINKNISEPEIFETVKDAFRLGWQVIKLYFMIGLPTETEADLQAIVDMVKRLRRIKISHQHGTKINVSIATFIPKAHTPFQWASQMPLDSSMERINWIKHQLNLPGIQFKWQNPEVSFLEGIFARGDRRLASLLEVAYKKGCKFDGWSDKFSFALWKEAIAEAGVDFDFFTVRRRDIHEALPWDHIDTGVNKRFLIEEWKRSIQAGSTADCRNGDCIVCGVCDFDQIEPRTFRQAASCNPKVSPAAADSTAAFKKLSLDYSKLGPAKYFGHLELVNIFLRALRRAGIPVKFSQGFHPKPKVSFEDPLPVGLESQHEILYLTVPDDIGTQKVVDTLNANLPEGLFVNSCRVTSKKAAQKATRSHTYKATLMDGSFNEKDLQSFRQCSEFIVERKNRKGKLKKIDLKAMVLEINLIDPGCLQMKLGSEPGKTLRPAEVLRQIFSIPEEQIKRVQLVKIDSG
jgi:radical SAM family uncharacterized protein/radical SAM-linked protein